MLDKLFVNNKPTKREGTDQCNNACEDNK